MIKLSPPQQETLAALARLAGDESVWVVTAEIIAERLRTKGLEKSKGKKVADLKSSTEQALEHLQVLIPQLVLANKTSWKLTATGKCVVDVQLGMKGVKP